MAKQDSGGGFFDRMFRPLKKHKVTLTKAGKQAPLRKGKPRKPSEKKAQAAEKARPKTGRERQLKELKLLANIGKQDPERLAGIISRMLLDGQEKEEAERLKFERLIWEKAEKKKPDPGPPESGEAGEDSSAG
jgi:hypothetical protein